MVSFEWDAVNIAHLARHQVSPDEAEQALSLNPLDIDSYVVDYELRSETVGMTNAGRILKTVSVNDRSTIRVLTAFDAPASLKERYMRAMVN